MTPKQHFRALQIRLEIAEFGLAMPLDRERVKELREQVEQARKDAACCEYHYSGGDMSLSCGGDTAELDTMTSDGVE